MFLKGSFAKTDILILIYLPKSCFFLNVQSSEYQFNLCLILLVSQNIFTIILFGVFVLLFQNKKMFCLYTFNTIYTLMTIISLK